MLSEPDSKFLDGHGYEWTAQSEGGHVCVVVEDFALPDGYDRSAVDLLMRLPAGFPDTRPDMWWLDPAIKVKATNAYPQAADHFNTFLGRTWQRFSRHLTEAHWRSGVDGLREFVAIIHTDLKRWV